MLHYWKGLKQSIKDDSKIDPTTGSFWTSFEDLAKHTITISRHTDLSPVYKQRDATKRVSWKSDRLARLKLKQTYLKPKPPTQDRIGRNRDMAGKGGGRGGRGGGGFRGGGYNSDGGRDRDRDRGHHTGKSRGGDGRPPTAKPNHCQGILPDHTVCNGGGGYHKSGCPKA